MKTIRALTLVCMVFAPVVKAASEPAAELLTSATPADVTIRGVRQAHYRLAPGETLLLLVMGPAPVRFEVRVENGPPAEPVVATLDLDDEFAATPPISPVADPAAISDGGLATSQAASLPVSVPAGKHTVGLRWPAGASAAALVAIKGVKIGTKLPRVAELPPLPPKRSGPAAAGPPPLPPLDLPLPATPKTPPPPPPAVDSAAAPKPLPSPSPEAVAAQAPVQPSAVAAAPAATGPAKPAQLPVTFVAQVGPRSPGPEAWTLALFAGAERGSENFIESSTLAHLGLEATRTAWVDAFAVFQLDWRISRQTYVLGHPSAGASSDASRVDEQRWDALFGIGYDFGPLLQTPRLVLAPVVGLKYVRLQNTAFPADLFGVDLGGRARYSLSQAVAAHASFGWMYNLVHASYFSALGSPLGQFGVRAGLDFPLARGYALSLDYQGDILTFDYSYRVAHGAAAGFGKSF